jgi:hypothetical protein
MSLHRFATLVLVGLAVAGCNRNMEPYLPGEKPEQPDLSKIFPAGAERAAGGAPAAAPMRGMAGPASDAAEPVAGTVVLAEELSGRIPPGAVLFVIARHGTTGPPMAVKRIVEPSFPFDFSIGPEDRMSQRLPFAGPLQVTVRLDADGKAATREPGDLQGRFPDTVAPGARGLTLTIDEVLQSEDE